MTKRVRVLKEMPDSPVGTIKEIDEEGYATDLGDYCVDHLIKTGFVEWVEEEKTLEEKLGTMIIHYTPNKIGLPLLSKFSVDEILKITKEHYISIFDKCVKEIKKYSNYKGESSLHTYMLNDIRKALEEA